jgi:hypothetical protein
MAENRRRLNWGTLAAVAVAGSLLAGAVLVMTALEERVEQSREFTNTFDGTTRVIVEVDSTDVQIGVSTDGTTSVRTQIRWNTRQPGYTAAQVGGTLTVRLHSCGFNVFGAYCESHMAMTVPATVDLRLNTDSGGVRVAGLRGNVRVDGDSADLDLARLSGPVTARLDSGRLVGANLTSSSVEAELESGDVDLQFDTAPASVRTRTDSGHVVIAVPSGTGPYVVKTNTDSGATRVDVPTGPSVEHQIDASTDSGDITIRYQTV